MQKLAESGLLGGEAEEMMLETTGIDGNQNEASNEPLKDLFLGKRHPMIHYMSDNETKFFIVKAPNEDYLKLGARSTQWALSQKALGRLSTGFTNLEKEKSSLVLVSLGNSINGVFRFTSKELQPASEDWLKVYPGPQK
jgi:hypothetical protein